MLLYNISVDQFLFEGSKGKSNQRQQLDAMSDRMSDEGIQIITAAAKEIMKLEYPALGKEEGV